MNSSPASRFPRVARPPRNHDNSLTALALSVAGLIALVCLPGPALAQQDEAPVLDFSDRQRLDVYDDNPLINPDAVDTTPADTTPANVLPQFVGNPAITVFGTDQREAEASGPVDIFGDARVQALEREEPENIPPVQGIGPDNPFLPVPALTPGDMRTDFPAPDLGFADARPLAQGAQSSLPGIVTTNLGALDSGGIGIAAGAGQAIDQDMFQGMSHAEAARLLSFLPVSTDSSVLHNLRRSILLTGAVPRGENSGADLLAIRLDRLAAQGDVMAMLSLAEAASDTTSSETVATFWANAFLAAGNNAGSCKLANEFVGTTDDQFWFKLLSFCQILAGEPETAKLGAELLLEQGIEDEAYYALLDRLTGNELSQVTSLPEAIPLHLAMIQAADLSIPEDAFDSDDNVLHFALARAPNSALGPRLQAMLAGERRGVFERNKVAEIYAAVPFAPQELIDYEQRGVKPEGPLQTPFLFQMAVSASSDSRRAQILSDLWTPLPDGAFANDITPPVDTYGVALASLPAVRMIAPNPDLARFAAGIVRTLVLGGDYGRAQAWFGQLIAASEMVSLDENPNISAAYLELWPILQFVAAADPAVAATYQWPQVQAEIWGRELLDQADESRRSWMGLFFAMAEATGRSVDEALLRRFMDQPVALTGTTPSYHIWRALGRAAAERRAGEVAILSLIALGENGVTAAHPAIVVTVLSSLVAVGLEREANQLAAEILIARGP